MLFLALFAVSQTLTTTTTTTTTLHVHPGHNGFVFGETETLVAHVVSSTGHAPPHPTGSVEFFLNGSTTAISTAALNHHGEASIQTSLPLGAGILTAVYEGDTNFSESPSNPVDVTVSASPTHTRLKVSAARTTQGTSITFTATVDAAFHRQRRGGGPVTTGSVAFYVDGSTTAVTTSPVNTSGQATYTTPSLAVGKHTVVAMYQATVDYAASTSRPAIENVIASQPTITTSAKRR